MDQLSEHFTLKEACYSSTALRLGIDNKPSDFIIPSLQAVALHILEPVMAHYGKFSPSSWYRCHALNKAIGSKDSSQHIQGEAVDFEIHGTDNLELAYWCVNNLAYDKLILEYYEENDPSSGWVHCSYSKNFRAQILTIWKGGSTTQGLPA